MELGQALPEVFTTTISELHKKTGVPPHIAIPLYLEFIAYQIYQLAPMEIEQHLKAIHGQCKNPGELTEEMRIAREDLMLTLDFVIHT